MNVLHINSNYLFSYLHKNMTDALSGCNINSYVFVPMYDKNRAVYSPGENVNAMECFNKWDRAVFDYKQSKIIKCAESLYGFEKIDLIHAYTLFTDGNSAMKLSIKYGIPYVVAIRATDVNVFFKKMVHLRKRGLQIMLNASAVFFLSESHKNEVFCKYIPKNLTDKIAQKTYIIPNGIDDFWLNNIYSEPRNAQDGINIVYAGRIDKNKNITATQKAISILNKKDLDVRLTVVGWVDDEKEFKRVISDKNTKYLKQMPKEQLISVYRRNDMFVMPSYSETFGLVYAEAMSQGLPVIYTKGQGFDHQFRDGLVGYAVNPHSPEDIAEKMQLVLLEKEKFNKECISSVKRFDWKSIAAQYAEIYRRIKSGYWGGNTQ